MSSDEVSAHLHTSGTIRWERGMHPRATLDDIDREQVERYLALRPERRIDLRYTSWEELLLGMQCAARDPQTDEVRPTNVGLLMFGRDPQWFIPQSEVVCIMRDLPGYMERVGAGIRFMVNEMRNMELPDPDFHEHHEFLVTFRNGESVSSELASTLLPRQLIGLRLIQKRGSITSREYCEATDASERTALRELRDLADRGIIVIRGRTRSARYYLP
jgi:predicted HTH transcriptional regulator